MDKDDVLKALGAVQDPELRRSIVELGMVRDIVVDEHVIGATIVLTTAGCPLRSQIRTDAEQALATIRRNERAPCGALPFITDGVERLNVERPASHFAPPAVAASLCALPASDYERAFVSPLSRSP